MPGILACLHAHDISFLHSVAELWGVTPASRDAQDYARELAAAITDAFELQEMLASCRRIASPPWPTSSSTEAACPGRSLAGIMARFARLGQPNAAARSRTSSPSLLPSDCGIARSLGGTLSISKGSWWRWPMPRMNSCPLCQKRSQLPPRLLPCKQCQRSKLPAAGLARPCVG